MRFVSFCLAAALAAPALAAEDQCLRLDRLDSLSYVDRTTITATERRGPDYTVKLAGRCGYTKLSQTLLFERDHLGTCLDKGDVLYSEFGAPCFVESVTVAEADPAAAAPAETGAAN